MEFKLSDRNRWILASLLLSIAAIVFAVGWTSPFWPSSYPILGSDFFKLSFFFILTAIFIVFYIFGLYLLVKPRAPQFEPITSSETI